MLYCDLCHTSFSSHHAWDTHVKGKKHIALAAEQEKRWESAQRSIYVRGFRAGIPDIKLSQYFGQFGKIEHVVVDKIKGEYAIIEFSDKQSAEAALSCKQHMLGGRSVSVKPRRLKEPNAVKTQSPVKKKPSPAHDSTSSNASYESIIDVLLSAPDVARQMVLLTDVLKLTQEEIEDREVIRTYFQNLFAEYFIYSEINLFGSSSNRLGVHGCDVDILLSLKQESEDESPTDHPDETNPDSYKYFTEIITQHDRKLSGGEFTNLTAIDVISLVKLIIRKRGSKCSHLITIPSRRCPIVHFSHNGKTTLSCDLSVKNRLSVYNTKLIRLYMDSDSRIIPFVFTIRFWAKRRDLAHDKSNRISSYATTMLVIYFLQQIEPPVLPTVEQLRQLECEKRVQGGWDCSFCDSEDMFPVTENTDSIVDLLKGFFNFYNQFDFENNVISTYAGTVIPKGEIKTKFPHFKAKGISVQDPFDFSHNITANMSDHLSDKFIRALSDAAAICEHEYIWHQSRVNAPWGLIALFDNIGPRIPTIERDLVEDNMDAVGLEEGEIADVDENMTAEVEADRKRKFENDLDDECSVSGAQIRINVLSACDVEQIRNCVPSSSKVSSFDTEWFRCICQAVFNVFSVALKFSCSAYNYERVGGDSDKSHSRGENPRPSSNKRMKSCRDECIKEESISEEEIQSVKMESAKSNRLDRVMCHVYHRTWVGRKKAKKSVPLTQTSVVEAEGMISKYLIDHSGIRPKDPVYSFLYRVELTSLLEVFVTVTSLTEAMELNGTTFNFLQSYVPRVIRQMHDARQITIP